VELLQLIVLLVVLVLIRVVAIEPLRLAVALGQSRVGRGARRLDLRYRHRVQHRVEVDERLVLGLVQVLGQLGAEVVVGGAGGAGDSRAGASG